MFKTVVTRVRVLWMPLMLAAMVGAARAAPADDAGAHFQAIAAGDVARLIAAYADNARLHWVGGPLNGDYATAQAIRDVWTKFTSAQGRLALAVGEVRTSGNPQGVTVTADVQFTGKATIKVRYVLTWRAGKIVSEIWQIDPNQTAAATS